MPPESCSAPLERAAGLPRDEVDHSSDRVGAVERGGRALDDLDPVEPAYRLPIQVDDAALDAAGADQRLAIDQDQDLTRVDALHLFARGSRRLGSAPRHDTRQLAQHLSHGLVSRVPHPLS